MSTATVDQMLGGDRRGGIRPVAPRLRLTKRGRGVLTTLAAAPLVIAALVFALNGGMATATLEGTEAGLQYVTVDTGQGLWEVAETVAPNADPRDVIADDHGAQPPRIGRRARRPAARDPHQVPPVDSVLCGQHSRTAARVVPLAALPLQE